ncbi:MAG: cytochrome C oxidase subunit I [Betaproteobacteria bacterium]
MTGTVARRASRLPLVLVALVCLAPMVASYVAYYLFPRDSRTNYGALLATAPAPAITGTTVDGQPFALAGHRGQWVMLSAAGGRCDARCERALYATRQARAIQGRERDRVARVWLVTDGTAPAAALVAEHTDLAVVRTAPAVLATWPRGGDAIYLIDPLGNEVLAWPVNPDIKALAKDLTKLLRASQIG